MPPKKETELVPVTEESVIEAAAGIVARKGDAIGKYLRNELDNDEVTRLQAHQAIIEEILGAPTLDAVLDIFEPEDLANFEGRHIILHKTGWNDSTFDEGPPKYVSLRVEDVTNGTKHLVNTGQQSIMAQCMKFDEFNQYPYDLTVWLNPNPNRFGKRLAKFTKWSGDRG